jgi:hypothetical protein
MTQKIWALGGSGIVAVLIIAGIFLFVFGVNSQASSFAIWAGVIIAVILGILGIIGVVISILKRLF